MVIHIEAKSPQFRKKVEKEVNEFLTQTMGKVYYGQPLKNHEKHADILITENKSNKEAHFQDKSEMESIYFTADVYYQMDKISENCLPEFTKPRESQNLTGILHFALQRVNYKNLVPSDLPKENSQNIIIQNKEALIILKSDEILYIEAWGKYCYVYMTNGIRHILFENLGSFSERMATKGFVQCHKSFVVNINHIGYIQNDFTIKLTSGASVPLARRRSQAVKEAFGSSHHISFYLSD
mgnify:CR=1 FL=1